MYACMYIYIYMYACVHIYIYIYIRICTRIYVYRHYTILYYNNVTYLITYHGITNIMSCYSLLHCVAAAERPGSHKHSRRRTLPASCLFRTVIC